LCCCLEETVNFLLERLKPGAGFVGHKIWLDRAEMATNDGMKMGAMAPWNLGRDNEACRLEG